MKITNSSDGKGRLGLWFMVFGLAVVALAGGWYVRLRLTPNRAAPVVAPIPVRAKIKLPPPPAPAQHTENMTDSMKEQPGTDNPHTSGVETTPVAASAKPAAPTPVAHLSNPPVQGDAREPDAGKADESGETAPVQPSTQDMAQPAQIRGAEAENRPATPVSVQPVQEHTQPDSATPGIVVETAKPFAIQVGAFHTKAYADRRMSDLSKKGYDSFVSVTADAQQRTLYLVRVGHFETRRKALDFLAAFKEKENVAAIVTLAGPR